MQSAALILRHKEGSPLLWGTEDVWYTFMSFDGFHLVNNWTALAEHRNWYYDLQLFESEECRFSMSEVNGDEMVCYEGWWYLDEDTLSLSMMRSSGQHPESPELDYIIGDYLVETWEPGSITLSFVSGEILTLDMEESGQENFFGC